MVEQAATSETHTTEPEEACDSNPLDDFYQWAKRVGHYHATEAIERYRTMLESKNADT
jgi:hypothetical protein